MSNVIERAQLSASFVMPSGDDNFIDVKFVLVIKFVSLFPRKIYFVSCVATVMAPCLVLHFKRLFEFAGVHVSSLLCIHEWHSSNWSPMSFR